MTWSYTRLLLTAAVVGLVLAIGMAVVIAW
jgi:hypothetical protein